VAIPGIQLLDSDQIYKIETHQKWRSESLDSHRLARFMTYAVSTDAKREHKAWDASTDE